MYEKLIRKGVNFIYTHGNLSEDDREVYSYGLELTLMYIVNAGIILILGAISGRFLQTFVLLAGFALLQSFGGGYHASSHLKCLLLMVCGWSAAMLLIPFAAGNTPFLYFSASAGLAAIFLFSPVEHKNFPFGAEKAKRMKKTVRITALIFCMIIAGLNLFDLSDMFPASLGAAMFLAGISVSFAYLKKN